MWLRFWYDLFTIAGEESIFTVDYYHPYLRPIATVILPSCDPNITWVMGSIANDNEAGNGKGSL